MFTIHRLSHRFCASVQQWSGMDSFPLGIHHWTKFGIILLCGRPSCMEQSTPVREADSLHSFRHKLKTHLFTVCFSDWLSVFIHFTNFYSAFLVQASREGIITATCLLTYLELTWGWNIVVDRRALRWMSVAVRRWRNHWTPLLSLTIHTSTRCYASWPLAVWCKPSTSAAGRSRRWTSTTTDWRRRSTLTSLHRSDGRRTVIYSLISGIHH